MNKSDSIKELATALCKSQAEMSGAKKSGNNPFFKSKYADLGSVVEAVKTPFANHGLSYSQFPVYQDNKVGVETILMHESGEWISDVLVLPMTKQDPQAAGSAITYARRYALQAIAGIPAEDDDGNKATQGQAAKPVQKVIQEQPQITAVDKQWIDAVKADPMVLNQIKEAKYKSFIAAQVMEK